MHMGSAAAVETKDQLHMPAASEIDDVGANTLLGPSWCPCV